jgi:DNA-binding PadR family transcriptional regulator
MRFQFGHHPFARHGHDHGHDHRDGHRGFRRGGGRGGRFFDQGDLRLVILALLAEQPRHGYEIIKEIEDRLGGAYAPSPGVVYPTLTLLEELGFATLTSEGPKKLYTVTPEGQAHLEHNRATVDGIFARIDQAGSGRGFAPRIMRAMANVKVALRLRLSAGPLTAEQVDRISAALDAAARDIERS